MKDVMKYFFGILSKINKLSYIFIAFCFIFPVSGLIYFICFRTPAFLFDIKNQTLENEKLMNDIGGGLGYDLYYSGDKVSKGIFRVKINGQCKNASLIINGLYSGEMYTITDTMIVKCRQ